jgi:hypothetical protein
MPDPGTVGLGRLRDGWLGHRIKHDAQGSVALAHLWRALELLLDAGFVRQFAVVVENQILIAK